MIDAEMRKTFQENLTTYMEIYDYTQQDLASKLGVSRQIVSDWMSGKKYPRIDKMQNIADVFNVDMNSLMFNQTLTEAEPDGETELLKIFRNLNEEGQESLLKQARMHLQMYRRK